MVQMASGLYRRIDVCKAPLLLERNWNQLYDANGVHAAHDKKRQVELEPFSGKIGVVFGLMVVVLKQLAHQQNAPGAGIFRLIGNIIVAIPQLMPEPIDNGALNGTHKKMHRQQQVPPGSGCKK